MKKLLHSATKKVCSYQPLDVIMNLQHEVLTVCYCAKIHAKLHTKKFLRSFFSLFLSSSSNKRKN